MIDQGSMTHLSALVAKLPAEEPAVSP